MNRIKRTWTQLSGRAKAVLALILMIYVGMPIILASMHLHINYTDSVPVGLYREVRGPAEYAALCVPESVLQHAMRAGLEIMPGDCPGGVAPILKPVFRASVDRSILYGEAGFVIAGKLVPNTAPKRQVEVRRAGSLITLSASTEPGCGRSAATTRTASIHDTSVRWMSVRSGFMRSQSGRSEKETTKHHENRHQAPGQAAAGDSSIHTPSRPDPTAQRATRNRSMGVM